MPLCTLDNTDPTNITTHTYVNNCEMAKDTYCYKKKVNVLHGGECKSKYILYPKILMT